MIKYSFYEPSFFILYSNKKKKHFATVSNIYAQTKAKNTPTEVQFFIQQSLCKIYAKISVHCVQT